MVLLIIETEEIMITPKQAKANMDAATAEIIAELRADREYRFEHGGLSENGVKFFADRPELAARLASRQSVEQAEINQETDATGTDLDNGPFNYFLAMHSNLFDGVKS